MHLKQAKRAIEIKAEGENAENIPPRKSKKKRK
jgi:hypothetical protein